MSEELAPRTDRCLLIPAARMAALTNTMNAFFHQGKTIDKSFLDGWIGHAVGFDWLESEMTYVHVNGTRTDTTPVTDTSAATFTTLGATTLVTTGQGNTETLKVGDVFTIDDVFAVNQETKAVRSYLKQFVITADLTADTTDTFSISPAIYVSGPRQNVSVSNAGSQAIVHVAAGGSGAAGGDTVEPLAYHRDFCTFVTADLHIEPGQRMHREVMDGISMRLWHGSDFTNDEFLTRVDILYGSKVVRPEWAARVHA